MIQDQRMHRMHPKMNAIDGHFSFLFFFSQAAIIPLCMQLRKHALPQRIMSPTFHMVCNSSRAVNIINKILRSALGD